MTNRGTELAKRSRALAPPRRCDDHAVSLVTIRLTRSSVISGMRICGKLRFTARPLWRN